MGDKKYLGLRETNALTLVSLLCEEIGIGYATDCDETGHKLNSTLALERRGLILSEKKPGRRSPVLSLREPGRSMAKSMVCGELKCEPARRAIRKQMDIASRENVREILKIRADKERLKRQMQQHERTERALESSIECSAKALADLGFGATLELERSLCGGENPWHGEPDQEVPRG